jgi:response regulator RpfG family c-di-GMP phosphodiesterase
LGPGKTGEAIPLSARIVALADVYDALASPRSYKASWPNEDVVRYIESKRGQQFDPQLVDIFLELQPVFSSIREKYR